MRSEKTGRLRERRRRRIHDEGHENHGAGQELGLEGDDEEGDLASGIVLGVSVRKSEGEGSEESVGSKDASC
jgi:hypothetical protein